MPQNPRQQIKHDLERAISHVGWITDILLYTGEKYKQHHPEITEQYKVVYAFFEQGQLLLEGLRDKY